MYQFKRKHYHGFDVLVYIHPHIEYAVYSNCSKITFFFPPVHGGPKSKHRSYSYRCKARLSLLNYLNQIPVYNVSEV